MTDGITELADAVDAATVVGLLTRRPRLLALGEPTHGEDDLLEVRNALFRGLVEHAGYRTIAIESDCLAGAVVDDYVTSGAGDLDDVLQRGFSHEWGAFAGNRELVRWMREYNRGRPASERLRFAGFDGPLEITGAASPRAALTGLYDHLAARVDADLLPCSRERLDDLLGADERWPDPAAMTDPSASVGRTPEAGALRVLADDLAGLLDEQTPHLVATSTPDEWDRARLHARTATGLLRYHYWMAATSPGRMARLLGVRDAMMAGHLLALAERGPTLVSAHNAHLVRNRSSMRMGGSPVTWWSAGAIVGAHLGAEYAVLVTALGTLRHRGVDEPPPDTVEGMLYALPQRHRLVDARRLAAMLGGAPPAARVSPWFGYAPLDPAHLAADDGIVFVRDVRSQDARRAGVSVGPTSGRIAS